MRDFHPAFSRQDQIFPTLHIRICKPRGSGGSLCLYDQPWYEVQFDWNPVRFLERIVWWLEETAHGSLHQPDQPLEPLLFDSYSDLIIPSELRTMPRVSHRWAQVRRINRMGGNYTLALGGLTGEPKAGAADQCAVVVMATRPMDAWSYSVYTPHAGRIA